MSLPDFGMGERQEEQEGKGGKEEKGRGNVRFRVDGEILSLSELYLNFYIDVYRGAVFDVCFF